MTRYFKTKERQELLRRELESWLDTPWRHRCSVKGAGCDCIGMVYGVMTNIGAVNPDKINMPEYPRDWHMHKNDELLYNGLKATKELEEIEVDKNRSNGDILLFKYGKACSHVGIYFDKQVYHAPTNLYVIKSPYRESSYFKRLQHVFTVVEVSE